MNTNKLHKGLLFFYALICVTLFSNCVDAQVRTTSQPAITNPDFDKVVAKLLNYKVDTISVQTLQKHSGSFVLLDIREKEEYEVSHIEGAKFLGYEDPDFSILQTIDLDTELIVYCSIGYRSEKMGNKLKKMGFKKVKNLYGSIFEWANQGYPLFDTNNQKTNIVHGYNKRWSKWITNKNYEVTY